MNKLNEEISSFVNEVAQEEVRETDSVPVPISAPSSPPKE
jgi:hypothetical protein